MMNKIFIRNNIYLFRTRMIKMEFKKQNQFKYLRK